MTLIASWVAMDDNKEGKLPSSIYLASDSRITYLDSNGHPMGNEDDKQKIFISLKRPEMFAICGDYCNCVRIIKSLIQIIDSDDGEGWTFDAVEEKIQYLTEYFNKYVHKLKCKSSILYGTKIGLELFLFRFIFENNSVSVSPVPLGKLSQVVSRDGSGEEDFDNSWLNFNENSVAFNEADTSRGAFRCIYEAIKTSSDVFVGGKMQAAVIYRGHNAPHPIGIYYNNDCYVFGKKFIAETNSIVEYRNSEFEIVDPQTGKIAEGAQRQPFARR